MGIFGALWLILIVLKLCGVIAASWFTVIFWPIIVALIILLVASLMGVTVGLFGFTRR